MPKAGMEVGLLSIAVLLVLFFVATAVIPEEKGLVFNHRSHWFDVSDYPSDMVVRIEVSRNRLVKYEENLYSIEQLTNELGNLPPSLDKYYFILPHQDTSYGLVIEIQDLFYSKGLKRDRVIIGGPIE